MPDDIDVNAMLQAASEVPCETSQTDDPPQDPPQDPPAGQESAEPEDQGHRLRNELANAERFITDISGKAWFCPQQASSKRDEVEAGWYVWDGTRLAHSENGAIWRLARSTALALSGEAEANAQDLYRQARECDQRANDENIGDAEQAKLRNRAKSLRKTGNRLMSTAEQLQAETPIKQMIRHARYDLRIQVQLDELDRNPNLVNCANGVVDLRTGELLPHDPMFRCTRIAPVPYRPDADRGVLDKLLQRACQRQNVETGQWEPDPERVRYLQDAIGHAIFGHQRLQKVYICKGDGGDGKGTLFEAILDALGGGMTGYAMKASMQSFVQAKVSSHRVRDDVANMRISRMIFASEINRGEVLDEAFLKAISGEDTQRVRHLYGKEFEFRPICTPFLQVNGEPRLDPTDRAIWRRVEIIPFGPPLSEDEKDPEIRAQMHDPEKGGAALLAWIIEGAQRTATVQRIERAASVSDATAAFRAEQDLTGQFIGDMLRLPLHDDAQRTYVAAGALEKLWDEWITESGTSSSVRYNGKRLGATLRDLGCWSIQSRATGRSRKTWFGVTMLPDHQDAEELAADSFKPSHDAHLQRLREAAADGSVSAFPQISPTRAPARARADGFHISSRANSQVEEETGKHTESTDLDHLGDDADPTPDW